jgi:DNA-binding MarR family transcriptional regulator
MNDNTATDKNEYMIAEWVTLLGRTAYCDGLSDGLTPAQWTALRYFSRANRFSCTVSAFAEFHGTTRGTASQTVKSLVAQGYLQKVRCQRDGRSSRLALTEQGCSTLAGDPFAILVDAIADLSEQARTAFADTLEHLVGYIARERGKPPFGRCQACHYLQDEPCCKDSESGAYFCGFVGERLEQAELAKLCINFEPGAGSAMKHTLRKVSSRSIR